MNQWTERSVIDRIRQVLINEFELQLKSCLTKTCFNILQHEAANRWQIWNILIIVFNKSKKIENYFRICVSDVKYINTNQIMFFVLYC